MTIEWMIVILTAIVAINFIGAHYLLNRVLKLFRLMDDNTPMKSDVDWLRMRVEILESWATKGTAFTGLSDEQVARFNEYVKDMEDSDGQTD